MPKDPNRRTDELKSQKRYDQHTIGTFAHENNNLDPRHRNDMGENHAGDGRQLRGVSVIDD